MAPQRANIKLVLPEVCTQHLTSCECVSPVLGRAVAKVPLTIRPSSSHVPRAGTYRRRRGPRSPVRSKSPRGGTSPTLPGNAQAVYQAPPWVPVRRPLSAHTSLYDATIPNYAACAASSDVRILHVFVSLSATPSVPLVIRFPLSATIEDVVSAAVVRAVMPFCTLRKRGDSVLPSDFLCRVSTTVVDVGDSASAQLGPIVPRWTTVAELSSGALHVQPTDAFLGRLVDSEREAYAAQQVEADAVAKGAAMLVDFEAEREVYLQQVTGDLDRAAKATLKKRPVWSPGQCGESTVKTTVQLVQPSRGAHGLAAAAGASVASIQAARQGGGSEWVPLQREAQARAALRSERGAVAGPRGALVGELARAAKAFGYPTVWREWVGKVDAGGAGAKGGVEGGVGAGGVGVVGVRADGEAAEARGGGAGDVASRRSVEERSPTRSESPSPRSGASGGAGASEGAAAGGGKDAGNAQRRTLPQIQASGARDASLPHTPPHSPDSSSRSPTSSQRPSSTHPVGEAGPSSAVVSAATPTVASATASNTPARPSSTACYAHLPREAVGGRHVGVFPSKYSDVYRAFSADRERSRGGTHPSSRGGGVEGRIVEAIVSTQGPDDGAPRGGAGARMSASVGGGANVGGGVGGRGGNGGPTGVQGRRRSGAAERSFGGEPRRRSVERGVGVTGPSWKGS